MRQCDDCTLCCKLIGVPELGKPNMQWCTHCDHKGGGCRIHNTPKQPQTCKDYRCAWLLGLLPEEAKPNKTGIVVSLKYFETHDGSTYSIFIMNRDELLKHGKPAEALIRWQDTEFKSGESGFIFDSLKKNSTATALIPAPTLDALGIDLQQLSDEGMNDYFENHACRRAAIVSTAQQDISKKAQGSD